MFSRRSVFYICIPTQSYPYQLWSLLGLSYFSEALSSSQFITSTHKIFLVTSTKYEPSGLSIVLLLLSVCILCICASELTQVFFRLSVTTSWLDPLSAHVSSQTASSITGRAFFHPEVSECFLVCNSTQLKQKPSWCVRVPNVDLNF